MSEDMQKCARCGAEQAIEAKFCSNCGNALGVAAEPESQPASSSSSSSGSFDPRGGASSRGGFGSKGGFGARGGFGGSRGRGNTRSIDLPVDPDRALAAFAQAVIDNGGEIAEQLPDQIFFVTPYKDIWTTAGMTVKLDGEIRLAPNDQGGTRATVTTSANVNSMVLLFVIEIVVGLFLFGFGVIIGGLAAAYAYFKVNGDVAERLARVIIERADELR